MQTISDCDAEKSEVVTSEVALQTSAAVSTDTENSEAVTSDVAKANNAAVSIDAAKAMHTTLVTSFWHRSGMFLA